MDDKDTSSISQAEKLEKTNSSKFQGVLEDNAIEHELTFKHVIRNHKALVWWCFYFAMCAIGWYVFGSVKSIAV